MNENTQRFLCLEDPGLGMPFGSASSVLCIVWFETRRGLFCCVLENRIICIHSWERDGTDKSEILLYNLQSKNKVRSWTMIIGFSTSRCAHGFASVLTLLPCNSPCKWSSRIVYEIMKNFFPWGQIIWDLGGSESGTLPFSHQT
jgi:hypothetical protein